MACKISLSGARLLLLPTILILVTSSAQADTSLARKVRNFIKKQANNGTLISKLPIISRAVNTRKVSKANINQTSSIPPLLVEIPQTSIKELFWAPGVIDDINSGSPSQNSCNQFFGGQNDGESAGNGACHLAQNLAFSFQSALEGANSFCYLQKMGNAPVGVTVVGAPTVKKALIPYNDTNSKLIKMQVTGFNDGNGGSGPKTVFLELFGKETNQENKNLYEHKLAFCNDSDNVEGIERAVIKKNLEYTLQSLSSIPGEGSHLSSISSKITLQNDKKLVFNPNTDKEVYLSSLGGGCSSRKVYMFLKNGKIKQKSREDCPSNLRKSYSIMRYTGTSITSLRFREGATKDENFETITEFRGSRYVSAPANTEFNENLSEVDVSTDPFYSGAPTIDTSELNTFNCARTDIDATITVNLNNEELQDHVSVCENRGLEGMDFCREDSEVNNADQNFHALCNNAP